jgi:hypothetical protein
MPAWAHTLGPVVEKVARILSASSPDAVSVKSVLTRDKNKAAAARRVATPASPTIRRDEFTRSRPRECARC